MTDTTTPGGVYHRDYYGLIPCAGCAAGKLSRITSPDAIALDYAYDGQLFELPVHLVRHRSPLDP